MELVPEPAPGVDGDEVRAGLEGPTAGGVAVAPGEGEVIGTFSLGRLSIAGLERRLKLEGQITAALSTVYTVTTCFAKEAF